MNSFEKQLERMQRLRDEAAARVAEMANELPPFPSGPDDITPDHPLARALGLEKARAMFPAPKPPREPKPRRIGPTPRQQRAAERRQYVANRLAEGAKLREVAAELNVDTSRIWQIKKELGL